MITRRLTASEKIAIQNIKASTPIDTINAKKNYINLIIIRWVFENGIKNTWFALYTQYGNKFVY